MTEPVDDKAHIRHELDTSGANWARAEPEGERVEDALEIAFVTHTDGVTYACLRHSNDPEGLVLIYTPSEWEAFVGGAKDGEFNFTGD